MPCSLIREFIPKRPSGDEFIRFENVSFRYPVSGADAASLAGDEREQCLSGISFALRRGESLGIIGPTGCGKTTIINLLMRFYDVEDGGVFVGGRDVRTYEKDELHRKFGVVFQNDMCSTIPCARTSASAAIWMKPILCGRWRMQWQPNISLRSNRGLTIRLTSREPICPEDRSSAGSSHELLQEILKF